MPVPENDHDLLVRLDIKLDLLSTVTNELRSALPEKADLRRLEKLEASLGSVEAKVYMGLGALAVIQFFIHWLWKA